MTQFYYEYAPYTNQDGKEIPAFEIFKEDGEKIADTNENMPIAEQEAIARLLTSAPELLAVLRDIFKETEINKSNLHLLTEGEGKAFEKALTAVAKAESS